VHWLNLPIKPVSAEVVGKASCVSGVCHQNSNRNSNLQLQSTGQLRKRTDTSSSGDAVSFRSLNFLVACLYKLKMSFRRLKKSYYNDLYCINLHKKM